MNTIFAQQIPEPLIRGLFESDRKLGGEPRLDPKDRDLANSWLRHILIDFEVLDQHIVFLQKLYGGSFQYPRPRRDRWEMDQPLDPPESSPFPHYNPLSDQQVASVLEDGIEGLGAGEVATLLLNPYGLFDLFDCIDDVQPDYWLDLLHDFVSSQPALQQTWPEHVELYARDGQSLTTSKTGTAYHPADALDHKLDSAPARSKRLPDKPVDGAPFRRYRPWEYALAVAATIAIITVGWGVIRISNAVNSLPAQIAMLPRGGSNRSAQGTGIALNSSPGGRLTLVNLLDSPLMDPAFAKDNPEAALLDIRNAASPGLQAIIDLLQTELPPRKTIDLLRKLAAVADQPEDMK